MSKKIFVFASAARTSGVLTILKQFLNALAQYNKEHKYYIFISDKLAFDKIANVEFIYLSTESWFNRIKWDEFGFKKWIKINNIVPDLIISMQNTAVNYDVPQIIYYQQPLPLMEKKWNFFVKKERIYFLYKHFYPYFVKKNISGSTKFIVQIPFIKELFLKKFKVAPSNVYLIRPDIAEIEYDKIEKISLTQEHIHFIYPATPLPYKNHIDIVLALSVVKKIAPFYLSQIKVHFSLTPDSDKDLYKAILKYDLAENFIFEGVVSYQKILSLYNSVDALLFPSSIETFGLPLLEAASFGLPVLAPNLAYAKDVVGDYEGAKFLELHDINAWAESIVEICKNRKKYTPLLPDYESNWGQFFSLVEETLRETQQV